jgi:hypothetical protein
MSDVLTEPDWAHPALVPVAGSGRAAMGMKFRRTGAHPLAFCLSLRD